MDVLASLESDLETIRNDVKTPPTVRSAAARAVLRIQKGREHYVALVLRCREGGGASTAAGAATGPDGETTADLLNPLLLLLSHRDAPSSAMVAALGGVQRLVQAGVVGGDVDSVFHALDGLLARREANVDFKILQTVGILLRPEAEAPPPEVHVLRRGVGLIERVMDEDRSPPPASSPDSMLRTAALAALDQLAMFLYERLGPAHPTVSPAAITFLMELCVVPTTNDELARATPSKLLPAPTSTLTLTQQQQQPHDVRHMPNKFALELISSILAGREAQFASSPELLHVVQNYVFPMVLSFLRGRFRERGPRAGYSFPLLVRLMRTTMSVLIVLAHTPRSDEEAFFSPLVGELVSLLEQGEGVSQSHAVVVTPTWHLILTLETVLAAFKTPGFVLNFYQRSPDQFNRLVEALAKLVSKMPDVSQVDDVARQVEALHGRPSRGLDLLGDTDPPGTFTSALAALIAAEVFVVIADVVSTGGFRVGLLRRMRQNDLVVPATSTSSSSSPPVQDTKRVILVKTWRAALSCLSRLLSECSELTLVQYVTRAHLSLATSCGDQGLVEARDAFIMSMCREALPHWQSSMPSTTAAAAAAAAVVDPSSTTTSSSSPVPSSSMGGATDKAFARLAPSAGAPPPQQPPAPPTTTTTNKLLSPKHLLILKGVFNIAHGLGGILGSSWHIVLDTFEQLDHVMYVESCLERDADQANVWGDSGESAYAGSGTTNSITASGTAALALASFASGFSAVTASSEDEGGDPTALVQLLDSQNDSKIVESMLHNLFDSSRFLKDQAVKDMVMALSQLSFTSLAHVATRPNYTMAPAAKPQATPGTAAMGGSARRSNASGSNTTLFEGLSRSLKDFGERAKSSFTSSTRGNTSFDSTHSSGVAMDSPLYSPGAGPDNPPSLVLEFESSRWSFRSPPFALEKLVETCELNAHRMGVFWEIVSSTLVTVASNDYDAKLRLFAVKSMERLLIAAFAHFNKSKDDPAVVGPLKKELVKKFTQLVRSPHMDAKDMSLQSLYRVVSSSGHQFEGVWNLIVAELLIVSTTTKGVAGSTTTTSIASPAPLVLPTSTPPAPSSGGGKFHASLGAGAFKVVQLIMDDYRPSLDAGCLPSLALCLRAFGEQQDDVNVSLTAIHHLWLLCEKADEGVVVDDPESVSKANALWLHVFDQLKDLSLDPRMEVRNSALRSLCTNIVATGDRLTPTSWRTCALDVMFPLLDAVEGKAKQANDSDQVLGERLATHTDVRMALHHSSDTEEKQWRETRVTALQGASKVVCGVILRVPNYRELAWFPDSWGRLLASVDRVLRDRKAPREVWTGAISVWEELALLVCGVGSRTKYATPGMRVVNGTLIRPPPPSGSPPPMVVDQSAGAAVVLPDHAWLWPSLLDLLAPSPANEGLPYEALGEVCALLVNSLSELFESRDCHVVREPATLTRILGLTTSLVRLHEKPGSRFVSQLERSVLQLYRRLPPLSLKMWFLALENLQGFATGATSAATVGTATWSRDAPPTEEGDDFQPKAYGVYLELLAQAPSSVQADALRVASTGACLPHKVCKLGLAALSRGDLLESDAEDVWMTVIGREDVRVVLVQEAVPLIVGRHVPPAIEQELIRVIMEEGVRADFVVSADIAKRLMAGCVVKGVHVDALVGAFLVVVDHALRVGVQSPGVGALIDDLAQATLQVPNRQGGEEPPGLGAARVALERGYGKFHLVPLLQRLENVCVESEFPQARASAARVLGRVGRDGWAAESGV